MRAGLLFKPRRHAGAPLHLLGSLAIFVSLRRPGVACRLGRAHLVRAGLGGEPVKTDSSHVERRTWLTLERSEQANLRLLDSLLGRAGSTGCLKLPNARR